MLPSWGLFQFYSLLLLPLRYPGIRESSNIARLSECLRRAVFEPTCYRLQIPPKNGLTAAEVGLLLGGLLLGSEETAEAKETLSCANVIVQCLSHARTTC